MENYGRDLAFVFFIFIFFGGLVAYGVITGTLPGKTRLLKRSESPAAFFVGLVLYILIALAAICGAIDLILRMNHRPGLW
jgi:hypothetical protein